ncbi:unnamed protein product [Colias eurytheme]|nr:unnamed protein product [Colias eurytheme]
MVTEMLQFLLLSSFLVDLSYATIGCHEVQQSHLASLHERMNHMLSTLYSSPLLTKKQESENPPATTPKPETPPSTTNALEPPCYQQLSSPAPVPPVIFIAPQAAAPQPSPSYYGDARSVEYAYQQAAVPQPAWNYDQYYQQYYQPPPPVYPPVPPVYPPAPPVYSPAPPVYPPAPSVYPPAPYPYPQTPCENSYPYPPEYASSYRSPYPQQQYAMPYPSPSPYLNYQRPNEMPPQPQYVHP